MTTVQQPTWSVPVRKTEAPVLKVYNSLTRSKVLYDASHMGHARNYVTQDILRRIMTDYFGYDVHFVMNITDIDDKIILRARQNHLIDAFRSKQTSLTLELLEIVIEAWTDYVQSKATDKAWKQEGVKRDEKFDMHFTGANRAFAAILEAEAQLKEVRVDIEAGQRLVDESKDVLALALDKKNGSTVTDHSIFRSTAAYWEGEFFKDMQRLRVRDPDTLTRVTEYVPEIVSFVEGIVKNGYGYAVEGSNHGVKATLSYWKKVKAYHNCPAWVNYFLHTGHLHIEGLKMSKSLKNFITIDEILQKYSARQLRLAFLTTLWNSRSDFSDSLMTGEVRNIEATLNNFFTVVRALTSQARADGPSTDGRHCYGEAERELTNRFHQGQVAFRAALCDSFNTPEALNTLRELISRANVYINSRGAQLDVSVLDRIARWIGGMLRMFGLGEGESSEVGWGQESSPGEGKVDREEILMPYLRSLSSFRDGVRKLAIAKGDGALKDILALSDRLRDVDLVPLGVALDDQEDGKALVKLVPPAELIKARDEKRAQAEAKVAKKAAAVEAERQKKLKKLEKGRLPPQELFRPPNVPEGKYGSWDERGLPLTEGDGKELSKSASKKAQKGWSDQKLLHDEFLTWQKEQN
ncbi:hypothetical protein EUX98_g4562 [Antrodiella citrinella]|uniref:Uncharacterized protein n=1 Tax=Antrodiella citrinella TaxID=2447956 RepID=A0A4S4MTU5_9APHY|nr:hypothetical protein EUX98_g4562 [Antrodiella citrinella]